MPITPLSLYDLVDAFPLGGCAICASLQKTAEKTLQNILNDRILDEDIYAAFRARRGLCATHNHQLAGMLGSAQTLAIYYRAAFDEVVNLLDEAGRKAATMNDRNVKRGSGGLADKLTPTRRCVVCEAQSAAEGRLVTVMATHFHDERLSAGFEASEGFCLPHCAMVIRECVDAAALQTIIAKHQTVYGNLLAEMRLFIDKVSQGYGDADIGEEATSGARAARRVGGVDRIFGGDKR